MRERGRGCHREREVEEIDRERERERERKREREGGTGMRNCLLTTSELSKQYREGRKSVTTDTGKKRELIFVRR